MKNILVTGGAGFIGSHVVRHFVHKYPNYNIFCLDSLTYAGNLANLQEVEREKNYTFLKADIREQAAMDQIFATHKIDAVIHAAAESHVDRSILDPNAFLVTNILGTANLLQAAKKHWLGSSEDKLFYHISTDEVYGSLSETGKFQETTAYDPRSPYSASKASSDHIVRAFYHTYNLPVKLSNCSNNYGPNQFPEKLIPLFIRNIKLGKPLPVYGSGDNVRDWLYVQDHVEAIDLVFHQGNPGETYNIGGDNEWSNIDLVRKLCTITDELLGREKGAAEKLITHVEDRAGHDFRYAIDNTKISEDLGWTPRYTFEQGIQQTVAWYLENQSWVEAVVSGEYLDYYEKNYGNR